MIGFRIAIDAMDRPTKVIALSDTRHVMVLQPGQPRTVAVPSAADVVLVNATADVWVQFGGAAVLPTADITDGSAPELNPDARLIRGITAIGLVSAAACLVNLVFYQGCAR